MKTLLLIFSGSLLFVSVLGQKVTLRFETMSNKNYEVKIDGRSYYSSTLAAETSNSRQKSTTLTDLSPGSHIIDVYSFDATQVESNNTGSSIYSNTFQLRDGYDMVIAIRRNDEITFTEKLTSNKVGSSAQESMSETEFDKLLASIKAKWSQSARLTSAKAGVNSKTNYFTTEQVGQLISLITAENQQVELAKLAYPKVTDPDNFSEIYTLFNSPVSRDELQRFVNTRKTGSNVATTSDPNTKAAMATYQFNQLLQTVKNQYQQEGKVAVLSDAFNNTANYFTTTQLRQLISLASAENHRLSLLKLAYARATDVASFSSLNNLLLKQASRDELNYFVKTGGKIITTEQYANRVAISDSEFRRIHQKASLHFRQSSVIADVKAAFTNTNNYYSISQVRALLQLVATESDRLASAKLAYHRVTDPPAFTQLFDLFNSESSRNDLSNYINSVAQN